jgi:hypothetical protein
MSRSRNTLVAIWLASAVVVTLAAVTLYNSATRIPEFAGRLDPATIYTDPAALFRDPGLLGTAVEIEVTRAVRACMATAGFRYRGPVEVEALRALIDPEREGYGIAAGADVSRPTLQAGPSRSQRAAYEQALYGSSLESGEGGGGCAAAGRQALDTAVATLQSLPYSIARLETEALAHPAYQEALARWVECMADRGYSVASPETLVTEMYDRISRVSGDDARALADEERQTAADDFACRRGTIDAAMPEVAADLAPAFVEENRAKLQTLIPADTAGLPSGLGTGDVQVTLVWQNRADLDLYVTDPSGEIVYYGNDTSASGGQLDRDANYPCGQVTSPAAENVFWPTGSAPSGTYTAEVGYTSDCGVEGTTTFRLVIQVAGRVVEEITATVEPGGEYRVSFEVGS